MEILNGTEEFIDAKTVASSREAALLFTEDEKLEDLELDLLGPKANSETLQTVMSEGKDDSPILDECFK